MKEVIRIQEPQDEKPVEFTHELSADGWERTDSEPNEFDKVVYLGKCKVDGDMFVTYLGEVIDIHKGHLNSGKY